MRKLCGFLKRREPLRRQCKRSRPSHGARFAAGLNTQPWRAFLLTTHAPGYIRAQVPPGGGTRERDSDFRFLEQRTAEATTATASEEAAAEEKARSRRRREPLAGFSPWVHTDLGTVEGSGREPSW